MPGRTIPALSTADPTSTGQDIDVFSPDNFDGADIDSSGPGDDGRRSSRKSHFIRVVSDGHMRTLSPEQVRQAQEGHTTRGQKTDLYMENGGPRYSRKDVVREFQNWVGHDVPYRAVGSRKRGFVVHSTRPQDPRFMAVRTNEIIARSYEMDRPIGRRLTLEPQGGHDVTEEQILAWVATELFPGQEIRGLSNLEKGLNIYVGGAHVPSMIVAHMKGSETHQLSALILANGAEDAQIKTVKYGGKQGPEHVEKTMLVATNETARAQMRHFIQEEQRGISLAELEKMGLTRGGLRVGSESERWVLDKRTGELYAVYGVEMIRGCDEEDEGHYISVVDAMNGFAAKRLDVIKQYPDPDLLVVSTSTSPAGSPQNTRTNYLHPEVGPYLLVTDPWDAQKIRERVKDAEAIQALEQIAHHNGFADAAALLNAFPDTRLWNTAARQYHVGPMHVYNPKTNSWEIDVDLAKNYQEVFNSELGAIFEMLAASGPYSFGAPITINGKLVYDVRHFIRTIMGTADPINEFWRDADHIKEIVADTMTQGKKGAHTAARGVFANDPNPPGAKKIKRRKAVAHGVGRGRYTTPNKPLGTHEITAGGSAHLLPGGRGFAIAQVFGQIASLAYNEGKSLFDYISEKMEISVDELKGNRHATTREFFQDGPSAPRTQQLLKRLETIITFFIFNSPELILARESALNALRVGLYEADFNELAHGKGTLGSALRDLAEKGYTALQAAIITDAFERQEAEFWAGADPAQKEDYMAGRGGFEFEWPDVGAPGS